MTLALRVAAAPVSTAAPYGLTRLFGCQFAPHAPEDFKVNWKKTLITGAVNGVLGSAVVDVVDTAVIEAESRANLLGGSSSPGTKMIMGRL